MGDWLGRMFLRPLREVNGVPLYWQDAAAIVLGELLLTRCGLPHFLWLVLAILVLLPMADLWQRAFDRPDCMRSLTSRLLGLPVVLLFFWIV